MYKIGIIGDRDSVLAYMALGFSVFDVANVEEAKETLHRLAQSGEYAVLFLVENYAVQMADDMARYKNLPLPAITVIPGLFGTTGFGMANIKNAVERAVGADILFNGK